MYSAGHRKQPQSAAGVLSTGVELLGAQGWLADAEVLLLLAGV